MLRLILGLFVLCTFGAPVEDKSIKALEAWLKLYRSGEIDYTSRDSIVKKSVAIKFGVAPKNPAGTYTWSAELAVLTDAVVKVDDADAANVLLQLASAGIDAGKYSYAMALDEVRGIGEAAVARLTSAAAKEEVAKAARGDSKGDKVSPAAWQATAVRCLAKRKDAATRPLVETLLADPDDIVRVAAAEALTSLGDESSLLALVNSLEREATDTVLVSVVQSLQSLLEKSAKPAAAPKEPKDAPAAGGAGDPADAPTGPVLPESAQLAVRAALKALGRSTWRADMAIVRFLGQFRSLEAVPALIEVLERFQAHPEDVKSGKLSGLLQYQAHEQLVAMTGAILPADQPGKWRELWEREKDKMKVAEKPVARGPDATVASGFFGIPVQGTRVVFILDLSGSMDWKVANSSGKNDTGIERAKDELKRAMQAISPNASFTLVTFSGDETADVWSKDLVQASEKNRERFLKHVETLKARGGTNLWAGLEEALKIKTQVYGARYDSNVDEIFILSDGAPSVGAVIKPLEILRLVKESNRLASVRINAVFLNTMPPTNQNFARADHMDITAQELMKRLAEQNGGKFKEI